MDKIAAGLICVLLLMETKYVIQVARAVIITFKLITRNVLMIKISWETNAIAV